MTIQDRLLVWLLCASLCVVFVSNAEAKVPQLLNFQGYLTDASGKPQVGSLSVTFRLYASATVPKNLWEEKQVVAMDAGHFAVVLGSTSPLSSDLFANNASLYIGVQVGADPEMKPRMRVTSVPYSFVAQTLAPDATPDVSGLKIGGKTVIDANGQWIGAQNSYTKSESDSRYHAKSKQPVLSCRIQTQRGTSTVSLKCASGESAVSAVCTASASPMPITSSGVIVGYSCRQLRQTIQLTISCCKVTF